MKFKEEFCTFCSGQRGMLLLVVLAFASALIWAKARDPFRRVEFSFKTPDGGRTSARAVLPKRKGRFPVVLFIHGSGRNTLTTGRDLRAFAELGLAAVNFEYDKTNQAGFDAQMQALTAVVPRQAGAKSNSVIWVANSLGAQRSLSFLVRHPESQPQLMVRLAGGWVPELDQFLDSTNHHVPFPIHCPFFLVHGDKDEDFPVEDARRLAAFLQTNDIPTSLVILPDRPHKFEPDRDLIFRLTAEYCKAVLAPGEPLVEASQNYVEPHLGYFVPVLVLAGFWSFFTMRKVRAGKEGAILASGEKVLRWVACGLALLAIGETALHLVTPQLNVSGTTLRLAQKYLVPPKQQADFACLSSNSIFQGKPLKFLLQQVELANYNRELVNWSLDDQIYRDFVLSPVIDDNSSGELNWRRPLWENFYPRIRHETDMMSAAQIVVRFLRERVTIVPRPLEYTGIRTGWNRGFTDAAGFERLYVAALRSAGIPAKLDVSGKAEIWSENKWMTAPRLLVSSFVAQAP